MLKFSICLLVLASNFLIVQAQGAADYSESSSPVAREFKVEKKSKKEKKETETIAAIPSNISVPVTVVDQKGASIDSLTATDFKIFVDNSEVRTGSFRAVGNQPMNIIFLLDMSPSTDARFEEVKSFVRKMIENLRAEDKISLITFNQRLKVLNAPTNDRAIIAKALEKIESAIGGTALYDIVADIFKNRLPANEKTIVLMLTDGVDTESKKFSYVKSLDVARKYDVPITTFYLDTLADTISPTRPPRIPGLGNSPQGMVMPSLSSRVSDEQLKNEYAIGRNYLSELAFLSGGSTIVVSDYASLPADQIQKLAKLIRPQYYLAFEADAAKPQGRIKIRINRPQLKIRSRSRY